MRNSIIIKEDSIRIEFNSYNHEYGGLTFFLRYLDCNLLILSLEKYLGKEISNWENISKAGYYPVLNEEDTLSTLEKSLKDDFVADKLPLPEGYIEKSLPDGYWKEIYVEAHESINRK